MRIVFLGKGHMGTPLAEMAAKAGHSVQAFGSKEDPFAALKAADVVFLATMYPQAVGLAGQPGIAAALAGKIVVDITNPLAPDYMSLTVGHTSSAAEEIARLLPAARVVKAFSTVFAGVLAKRAAGEPVDATVFVAGDDAAAVESIVALAKSFGFATLAGGPLKNARYLEPMTEFMIQLAYGQGHGDKIGLKLLSPA